jgi:hypothetical protein
MFYSARHATVSEHLFSTFTCFREKNPDVCECHKHLYVFFTEINVIVQRVDDRFGHECPSVCFIS